MIHINNIPLLQTCTLAMNILPERARNRCGDKTFLGCHMELCWIQQVYAHNDTQAHRTPQWHTALKYN